MPIDHALGEVFSGAVEIVGDAVLDGTDKRKSRLRRLLSWSVILIAVGLALAILYFALT